MGLIGSGPVTIRPAWSTEGAAAAGWWAHRLEELAPSAPRDVLDAFERELAAWLDAEWKRHPRPIPLTTSDLGPQLNLSRPADAVGLRLAVGASRWPPITSMWVEAGRVIVYEGYNSHPQIVFPDERGMPERER